jgi:hypothetical protein
MRAGVFTLALSAVPFAVTASAQTGANTNASSAPIQTTRVAERDDNTDWGWLGLLGLVGLAGLLKKPQQVTVDRTADTTNRARA